MNSVIVPESRINPKFPDTPDFKGSAEKSFCLQSGDIPAKQFVNGSYEWTIFEQFRVNAAQFFLNLDKPSKSTREAFLCIGLWHNGTCQPTRQNECIYTHFSCFATLHSYLPHFQKLYVKSLDFLVLKCSYGL